MAIDFLGIQAFLAVAECGSSALAAERLHLTQTAISHRMRKLEESLGAQLVVRTSRGIALTQAGEALLPRARAPLEQLEASCDAARRHGQGAASGRRGRGAAALTAGCRAPGRPHECGASGLKKIHLPSGQEAA